MAKVSLAELKRRSAVVRSLINDLVMALPLDEDVETLDNEYDLLYSMILDVIETLDVVVSDVEK